MAERSSNMRERRAPPCGSACSASGAGHSKPYLETFCDGARAPLAERALPHGGSPLPHAGALVRSGAKCGMCDTAAEQIAERALLHFGRDPAGGAPLRARRSDADLLGEQADLPRPPPPASVRRMRHKGGRGNYSSSEKTLRKYPQDHPQPHLLRNYPQDHLQLSACTTLRTKRWCEK